MKQKNCTKMLNAFKLIVNMTCWD